MKAGSSKMGVGTLLREQDVARITNMSLGTLREWRILGAGPKYLKLGRSVRYDPRDLEAWMKSLPSGGGKPINL